MNEDIQNTERTDDDELFEDSAVVDFQNRDPMNDPSLNDSSTRSLDPSASRSKYSISVVNKAFYKSSGTNEAVPESAVLICGGSTLEAATNQYGNIDIDLSELDDGNYTLRVRAPETSNEYAGPGFPQDSTVQRVWRLHESTLSIESGEITNVSSDDVVLIERQLSVLLQPCWLRTMGLSQPHSPPSMIVVHHTASLNLSGDLNHLLYSKAASVDYVVDQSGAVYKLAPDDRSTWHAGWSYWRGAEGVNKRSIGIEILHKTGEAYPNEQLSAVQELIERLLAAFPSIDRAQVVGHSDVAVTRKDKRPPIKHGRKSTDPGSVFPWETYEALGIGLVPSDRNIADDIYGGVFERYEDISISVNDNDRTRTYGGVQRPDIDVDIVHEIQGDLSTVGYYCPHDGDYGRITQKALHVFQEHMFSGSRRRGPNPWNSGDGLLDRDSAIMLKRVVASSTPAVPA